MKLEARQRYSPPSRADTLARRRRASTSAASLIQDCGDKRPRSGALAAARLARRGCARVQTPQEGSSRPRGAQAGLNGAGPAWKAAWRRHEGTSQQKTVVSWCAFPHLPSPAQSTAQSTAQAGTREALKGQCTPARPWRPGWACCVPAVSSHAETPPIRLSRPHPAGSGLCSLSPCSPPPSACLISKQMFLCGPPVSQPPPGRPPPGALGTELRLSCPKAKSRIAGWVVSHSEHKDDAQCPSSVSAPGAVPSFPDPRGCSAVSVATCQLGPAAEPTPGAHCKPASRAENTRGRQGDLRTHGRTSWDHPPPPGQGNPWA